MGYVSESISDPYPELTCWSLRMSDHYLLRNVKFLPTPGSRTQYGFRSGNGSPNLSGRRAAIAADLDRNGQWADSASMIELLTEVQNTTTVGRTVRGSGQDVNHRDYSEKRCGASQLSYTGWDTYGGVTSSYKAQGAFQITSAPFNAVLPMSQAQDWAASKLRAAAPTRPDFNLTRFVGELRDTNRLFDGKNYIPPDPGSLGGAYLNHQFGITPTASDLQRGAEAVLHSDKLVREFVRDACRRVRRSGHLTSTSVTASGTTTVPSSVTTFSVNGVNIRIDPGNGGNAVGFPLVTVSASSAITQRCGTFFEFFVGDPYGYTSRMDSYVAQAEKVLGGGLDLSTTYQLFPFSWMLDWFVDIGSLLQYQQQVADNHLVMRNAFTITESEARASAVLTDNPGVSAGRLWTTNTAGSCFFYQKRQIRSPGNAYSMSPTWNLNPFQWSIAAALGLTKANRIPFIKNL